MDEDGYISCVETYDWNEEVFIASMVDVIPAMLPKRLSGSQTGTEYCNVLGIDWASKLQKNVLVIQDEDGRISDDEFDDEIRNLKETERIQLMKDIYMHPVIYKEGNNDVFI